MQAWQAGRQAVMMHGDTLLVGAAAEDIAQEIHAAHSCATSVLPTLGCLCNRLMLPIRLHVAKRPAGNTIRTDSLTCLTL